MLAHLLADLYEQTLLPTKIFVVENASAGPTAKTVSACYPTVDYELLPHNLGSAGGYHRLLEKAAPGCDFVWTLDDDVRLKPDTLERLVSGFNALAPRHRLGAVRSVGSWYTGDGSPTQLRIIPWRGTLFTSAVIREIGLPRSDYFLYGDDFEYSLRLEKSGYSCFWIPTSICDEKRSSNKTTLRIFGNECRVYATPFRHYYGVRNEFHAALLHRDLRHAVKVVMYAMKVATALALSGIPESPRMAVAIFAGMRDGSIGRLGRNPRYSP